VDQVAHGRFLCRMDVAIHSGVKNSREPAVVCPILKRGAALRGGAWRHFRRRIQPVDATVWLNRSAGVWKPSVFLGLSFNCLATALSLACE
jgi:hypothetical protein